MSSYLFLLRLFSVSKKIYKKKREDVVKSRCLNLTTVFMSMIFSILRKSRREERDISISNEVVMYLLFLLRNLVVFNI